MAVVMPLTRGHNDSPSRSETGSALHKREGIEKMGGLCFSV